MKALPLWQPWASLVAVGAKRVETRHWAAPDYIIGQRVAIHATKGHFDRNAMELEPFRRRLSEALDAGTLMLVDGELPLGAIIATVVIHRCSAMTRESVAELERRDPDERAFGYYGPDRFAWVLRDVERLEQPVPFTGRQGIFDVPDEAIAAAAQGELLSTHQPGGTS
jgi:hypothetical protein